MINEAIILSGGIGPRLIGATQNKFPKGLAEVKGKSLLYWCMHELSNFGVNRVIMALGHLSETVINKFGDSIEINGNKIEIVYSIEKEKLGSGGAIKLASSHVQGDHCFIMNGDVLTNIPLNGMITQHLESDDDATMLLVQLRSRFGVVESENNRITKFVEKPLLPVFIHSGVDIVKTSVLSRFPVVGQMEDTIFVDLVSEGTFGSFHGSDEFYWEAVDTPKELKDANKNWPEN